MSQCNAWMVKKLATECTLYDIVYTCSYMYMYIHCGICCLQVNGDLSGHSQYIHPYSQFASWLWKQKALNTSQTVHVYIV